MMYGEVGSRELSIRIVIIQRAEIVNRRDAETQRPLRARRG